MKTDPIQEFIIENERNMLIAAAVADGYLAARKQLVDGFLDRLGATIVKECKGWQHEKWRIFISDWEALFYLRKPEWDFHAVALRCFDYGERMEFGITRDVGIGKKPFRAEILAAVKESFPSARARTWWEAVVTMQSPAADWRKPEVLLRMHTDPEFLNEVAEQLLTVARPTAAIIDRFARAK